MLRSMVAFKQSVVQLWEIGFHLTCVKRTQAGDSRNGTTQWKLYDDKDNGT